MQTRRFLVGAAVVAAALVLSSCGYNAMQANEEGVNRAWGDLQAQLQRRADLIPNLVATVKGYAAHEKETLQAVVDARARVGSIQVSSDIVNDPQKLAAYAAAQDGLSQALSRLLVVTENYPNLKADQSFLDLQNQLEGTENRISVARQRYNAAVERFNYSIRAFPNSITNGVLLHLQPKQYFQAEAGATEAPKVQFK